MAKATTEAVNEPVNEWDPKTGEMVPIVPSDEALSFFEDDEGGKLYSFVIVLDGQKVRARELDKSELTEYNRLEGEVATAIQAVGSQNEAEAIKALESVPLLQAAAHDYVIERAVSGWELKRPDKSAVPCTPQTKKKLRPSKKAELVDRIVQRSQVGRELSSFLGAS